MEKLMFTILGKPITKKNSQRIVVCKNRPMILPSKAYLKYEKDCKKYMPDTKQIDYPINVKAVYYMPTHHRVDLTNLHEALHDILVKYNVIADDNCKINVSTDGSRVLYDRENPRTEVTITKAGGVVENH